VNSLTVSEILDALGKYGWPTAILIGGYFGVWVWGKDYIRLDEAWKLRFQEERTEKEYYRDLAIRGTNVAEGMAKTMKVVP
jgi:hypothetical protein